MAPTTSSFMLAMLNKPLFFYQNAFGFETIAYKGLGTGSKTTESFVLKQDKIVLVLSSPLSGGTAIGQHIDKHGDGVKISHFG